MPAASTSSSALVVARGCAAYETPARQLALVADVAAGVREERRHADAVAAAVAAGKAAAAAELGAELDEAVGRREPVQLHAVVCIWLPKKRLVGERRVDEVPGVGVLRVEVADRREEAAGLQARRPRAAVALEQRFLDGDRCRRR